MTQSIENDLGIQLLQKQFNHQSFHLKIETVNQQEDLIKFSRPNCVQVDYVHTNLFRNELVAILSNSNTRRTLGPSH